MLLKDSRIVLGVSGSIAAYKAADLTSKLVQGSAQVDVILTDAAAQFVTPLTFQSLTGRHVFTSMFEPSSGLAEEHVALARRADLILVAPATATTMARIAHGMADDLLALTVLATTAPVLLAPAMDSHMWQNAATQANLALLKQRGISFVGPEVGHLASGLSGVGRLSEPVEIVGAVKRLLGQSGDLAGKRLVISAGGTREPIDPVRFLSNYSSGKQGFALAEAARDRGAEVILVSTARALTVPYGVELVEVETAGQMKDAMLYSCKNADAVIMAAAVADYRPASVAGQKVKKGGGEMTLELTRTDDILKQLSGGLIKVGFAAETQDLLENAMLKLGEKDLDLICANDVTAEDAGFGVDTNRVTILDRQGSREELPLLSKYEVAHRVLDRVSHLLRR